MATKAAKGRANVPAKVLTGTDLALFEQRRAALLKQVQDTEASVASGNFFTIAGGVLSFQGADVPQNRMKVVILDYVLENAYYDGPYDPKSKQPPACYAFGRDGRSMVPHTEAMDKQAESCATCKWNEFGTATRQDGSPAEGKACKNIRRLALVPVGAADSPEKMEAAQIGILKVPVTSCKNHASYVKLVGAMQKRLPQEVITEVRVVPDKENQFAIQFEHVENIDDPLVLNAILGRLENVATELTKPYPRQQEHAAPAAARGGKGKSKTPAAAGKRRF